MIPSIIQLKVEYDMERGVLFIDNKLIGKYSFKKANEEVSEHFTKKVMNKKLQEIIKNALSN